MVTAIWTRDEDNYENFPGVFSGSVVPTKDKNIGHLEVKQEAKSLFAMDVSLPKSDKTRETFEKHMNDIMNGVIELKSKR